MGVMKVHTVRSFMAAGAGALTLLGLIALPAALVGCPSGNNEGPDRARLRQDGQAVFGRPERSGRTAGKSAPLVRLGATAVALPAGTLTNSEAVWGKLDHKPWPADVRALLALNGIRVGMLKSSAWPELAKTLEQLKGIRLKSARLPVYPASPAQVFLQRNDHHQTVFAHRLDETVYGMDYPPGDAMLAVHCLVDPATPARMSMTVMPQVRASRQKMRYTKTDGRYNFIKVPILHNFTELAWQISVTMGDVIVLGPGRGARRSSAVGRLFFLRDVDGATFETVVFLAPDVTMVGGPAGPRRPAVLKPTSRPAAGRGKPAPAARPKAPSGTLPRPKGPPGPPPRPKGASRRKPR